MRKEGPNQSLRVNGPLVLLNCNTEIQSIKSINVKLLEHFSALASTARGHGYYITEVQLSIYIYIYIIFILFGCRGKMPFWIFS